MDTSLNAQRQRVINALRDNRGGMTTIELREASDVMAPAPRVFELRHNHGYNIQTIWTTDVNAQGHKHRCARYVLMSANGVIKQHGNHFNVS